MLKRALGKRADIELIVASSGEQGLTFARQHQPELILLDLHLPDMDGSDVLENIWNLPDLADVPVIIVSADVIPGNIEKIMAKGVKEYVSKPIELEMLNRILSKYL